VKAAYLISNNKTIEICQGDITREQVDAIVNAANSHLAHGGGVAGAIVRAGGRVIQDESDAWVSQHGQVTHAKPAYTSAGSLPCTYVIHAVGPRWGEGEEDRKLEEAIHGSLVLAGTLGLKTLALPAISTGIFGFPIERAARIILQTLQNYYQRYPDSTVQLTRLILRDAESLNIFYAESQRLFNSPA
jgi:O-acetyl-ADP-ribose deacetylase (regulator of RNase III)